MKLVLFIGHHKVGSSSLQAFLSLHRRSLINAGILYPMIEEPGTSTVLKSLGRQLEGSFLHKSRYARIPLNEREPHNALAFQLIKEYKGSSRPIPFHGNVGSSNAMREIIRKQISRDQPESLVLCSEVFSNFGGVSNDLIEWMHDSFPAESVTIVCTLRRIDQYLCSWYGQRLKFGHAMPPLRKRGLKNLKGTIHFNYRKMLRPWQREFPGANFVLRNYYQVLQSGGSVADFIAQSGLDFPAGLAEYENVNASIPYCFYELCRKANVELATADARHVSLRVNSLSKKIEVPQNNRIELLGPENRAWLYKRFEGIHSYLAREIGESAFFPDQEDILRCNPEPEFDAASRALPALAKALGNSSTDRQIRKMISMVENKPY